MKKLIAAFAFALFIGGISAPAVAVGQSSKAQIVLNDEEPRKKDKKADKANKEATESSTRAEKKDCSKTCGGDKS
ncbi:MAG: hypothetical protein EHM46_03555 [Bacteroidetes bacterium]|nr:MAG: hypothetical protein EHM46_03555 [Bacteroidota bacterium]